MTLIRGSRRWLLALAVLVMLPARANAQAWSARAALGWVEFGNTSVSLDALSAAELGRGLVVAFDVRRELAPGLNMSVGLMSIGLPMQVNAAGKVTNPQLRHSAFTVGAESAVPIGQALEVYGGALIAGLSRESTTITTGAVNLSITPGGRWGIGAEAGVRWPGCASCAGLFLDARVTWLQVPVPNSTGQHPLLITIGVGRRF